MARLDSLSDDDARCLVATGRLVGEGFDHPYLEREDVLEALQYAAWLSQEREIVLATE